MLQESAPKLEQHERMVEDLTSRARVAIKGVLNTAPDEKKQELQYALIELFNQLSDSFAGVRKHGTDVERAEKIIEKIKGVSFESIGMEEGDK